MTSGTDTAHVTQGYGRTRTQDGTPTTDRAVRLIHSWSDTMPAGPSPVHCLRFPFTEATAAVRAHGTRSLPADLTGALRAAAEASRERGDEPPGEAWFTAEWLGLVVDMAAGEQSYAAYTMCRLFDAYCRATDGEGHPDHSRTLVAVLVADMIRHELAVARHPASRRTTAAVRLAADLGRTLGRTTGRGRSLSPEVALRTSTWVIRRLCQGQPAALRLIVANTVLNATREPDEYLFIRSVQIMELLAYVAARYAHDARSGCCSTDLPGVVDALRGLEATLSQATRVFRIVSTIDVQQFARIRTATYGTGALQSPAFAALERLCLGTAALRPETTAAVPLHLSPVPQRPLSDALAALLHRLPCGDATPVTEAVAAVDAAWVRWKRIHRGVARHIIGNVAGTGGSAGVAYLSRHMDVPLLAGQIHPPQAGDGS